MPIAGKLLNATRVSTFSISRFIIKYWYWIIFLIIVIPLTLGSIRTARETQNPIYPITQLGLYLTNADALIYQDTETLKENPTLLIGMEKPTVGLWNTFVYNFRIFLVFWRFLSHFWLISFPFVLLYKYFKIRGINGNESSSSKNFISAIFWGIFIMLIINCFITIDGLITGDLDSKISPELDVYQRIWEIFLLTLPFHGMYNLTMYLVSLI